MIVIRAWRSPVIHFVHLTELMDDGPCTQQQAQSRWLVRVGNLTVFLSMYTVPLFNTLAFLSEQCYRTASELIPSQDSFAQLFCKLPGADCHSYDLDEPANATQMGAPGIQEECSATGASPQILYTSS